MARIRVDFVGGDIENNPLGLSDTTLQSAGLTRLPVITAPDYIVLTLNPEGDEDGEPEIVYVTAHTTLDDEATITRGEENSTARAHDMGSPWIHGDTAEDWNGTTRMINTDGDPGNTIYVGSVDPIVDYSGDLQVGDVWLAIP